MTGHWHGQVRAAATNSNCEWPTRTGRCAYLFQQDPIVQKLERAPPFPISASRVSDVPAAVVASVLHVPRPAATLRSLPAGNSQNLRFAHGLAQPLLTLLTFAVAATLQKPAASAPELLL